MTDRTKRGSWRRLWPWLAGSLALHLSVLACLPGLDTPARCPVLMLLTLDSHAAEPLAALQPVPKAAAPVPVVKKKAPPVNHEMRAASVRMQAQSAPRQAAPSAASQQAVKTSPVTTVAVPITTTDPRAEPIAMPTAAQPATPASEVPPSDKPSGNGGAQGIPHGSSAGAPGTSVAGSADSGGSTQAVTGPDIAALKRDYAAAALARVQRAKFFPEDARDSSRAGSVVEVRVHLTISRSGELLSVSASAPEGNDALTRAAEQAVRSAAPFGDFPAGLSLSSMKLAVTLRYTLK